MNNKLAQNGQIGTEIKLHDLRFHHEAGQIAVPSVVEWDVQIEEVHV